MGSRLRSCLALFWALIFTTTVVQGAIPRVTKLDEDTRCGSKNGGTKITIKGENFARNFFNFGAGNENVGSRVKMVDLDVYETDIIPDGSHETQIMVYTRPMPVGVYTIKVSVDGEDVLEDNYCSNPDHCKFTVSEDCTPTIDLVVPRSGKPGAFIELFGNIITTKYGSNEPDEEEEMILRAYFGGQQCELRDVDNDRLYGIQLEGSDGWILCKTGGTYIGNNEISFLVSRDFGRSMPDGTTKHVRQNGAISMYETYTDIDGLSQSQGSTAGGTSLTLSGQHFDDTDAPVRVTVGDMDCTVVDPITDTEIVCLTPPDASTNDQNYAGNRGFLVYVVNGTSDAAGIDKSSTPAISVDESEWTATDWGQHALQMVGYFQPPFTGTYFLCLRSAGSATLFVSTDADPANKVEIPRDNPSSCEAATSSRSLTANERYYVEIHYSSSSADSYVGLLARLLETDYSVDDTGMAQQEIQDLVFTSDVTFEKYTLSIVPPTSPATPVSNVQQLVISGDPSGYFSVGLHGVFTVPLQIGAATSSILTAELAKVPSITFPVFAVYEQGARGYTLTITSEAPRGSISQYEIREASTHRVAYTHRTTTAGAPSLDKYALEMDGFPYPSPDIAYDASARAVESALLDLFSVRCHDVLDGSGIGKYIVDFEEDMDWIRGRTSNVEPFCGRYALENPNLIYHKGFSDGAIGLSVTSSSNRYMCFAYKGQGQVNAVYVSFTYKNVDGGADSGRGRFTVSNDDPDNWAFHCEDIQALISSATVGGTFFTVESVNIVRVDKDQDVYVDQVMFLRSLPLKAELWDSIPYLRMPQAQPNGAFIESVSVSGAADTGYEIVIIPHECGHNFPLLKVSSTSQSASPFRYVNGESLSVTLQRIETASPPIGGFYKITFNGDTTPAIVVNVSLSTEGLVNNLNTMSVGFTEVESSGICSEFTFRVTMMELTGDQPMMSIDDSRLTGRNPSASVTPVQDGALWFNPIMGSLLRTYHSAPQVVAYINNIPTRCLGNTCDYQWSSADTPLISSINPVQGYVGDSVVITGDGFDGSVMENNKVVIGETDCDVTGATTTTVTCTLNNGPNGEAPVLVTVSGKGLADGDVSFTYLTRTDNVSPSSGSLQGGTLLTIAGNGFSLSAVVTVGDEPCEIQSNVAARITCLAPAEPTGSTSSSTADVKVEQHGATLTAGTFTYDPSLTPVIISISPASSNVWGGESITIEGTGFGAVEMPVSLGSQLLEVTDYEDTQIIAVLPALPDGSYPVIVDVENKGYADLRQNSIPDVVYTFKVTSMTPTVGSLYGGTDVYIKGVGFNSNSSLMSVSLGPHDCEIQDSNEEMIKCRIADTGETHVVSATGTHINYGTGYAWNQDPLRVKVGDYVTWTWSAPSYISEMNYAVHETETANDLTPKVGGFSSGASTRQGSFTHRFTKTGTYFVWSGFVKPSISFRGTIFVEDLTSHNEILSVQQMGQEASYDTTGVQETESFGCAPVSSAISGCTDSTSLSPESGKFNFQFKKCFSPSITEIGRKNGTFADIIGFQGTGFGSQLCQNEVNYAGAAFDIDSVTSTRLNVQPSAADSPPIAVLEEFSVRVHGLGYALIAIPGDINRRFALMPIVTGLSPFQGSLVGGTLITVTGAGFSDDEDDVVVDFTLRGAFTTMGCEVESSTYTEIVCETFCSSSCSAKRVDISVQVVANGMTLPVPCEAPTCSFIADPSLTATVTNVSPTTVNAASTTLTISGSSFGASTSDLYVEIGGEACVVNGIVAGSHFTCEVNRLPVGENDIKVYVGNDGLAESSFVVVSEDVAAISAPAESGVNGGAALQIDGNGFVEDDTTVLVDGENCTITDIDFGQVLCTLPAHSAATVTVALTSNGVQYDPMSLTYSDVSTPTVTGVTPTKGKMGDTITISGSSLSSPSGAAPTVEIGGSDCAVNAGSSTATQIMCELGAQETGSFDLKTFVPERGFSNAWPFVYEVGSFTVSPNRGTTNGGQLITLIGSGFLAGETTATVCGVTCEEVSVQADEYVCKTPSGSAGQCAVEVTVKGVTQTEANSYTYDASLESTVTSVFPARGGTGGGTLITITGTNFGTVVDDISVKIAGADCDVQTVTDTQITCRTGAASSAQAQVEVQRNNNGLAQQIVADFEYIDLWSNPYTWGGGPLPLDGDFVVITSGQKILLDTNTTVLKMLLIQGGELIFDEENIELKAENILITDGGRLEAGTEERPFPAGKIAIITMYGHLRSKELAIYGAKTLAVREGTLDLHGQPRVWTWTHLEQTANAGDSEIFLQHDVEGDWEIGDEIVIATTSDRHSQKESELRTITGVTANRVTLDRALEYTHIALQTTFGGRTVEFRAEVGLFTRNVIVRGNRNIEFDTEVEACEAGFNTGEFATQTCFQGRFGEELGSDQFGLQIMVHQVEKDTQVAQAHLSYIALKHAGQAFRMGRYPIHFHLNGNMDKSYVRGCSIHISFNRAVNVHGSHNVLVEYNVIYNVMGGSFFLEDGDETGNIFRYNLAIFVRSSTSLRNDDITPAAFWATNPNNTISHNAVAGGTHFGTWYRMHVHPDGPGFSEDICPQSVPLGEFRNNSVHSNGWFGLWIFEKYVPRVGASCDETADHQVAKFYSLIAWNNEKGAESVDVGALQFHDFILVNNEFAGYEGKKLIGSPNEFDVANGPGIFDSLIVAHWDNNLNGRSTHGGVVIPYLNGFIVKDVTFINFDQGTNSALRWTRIDGTCGELCGGFTTLTAGLTFENSPNKVDFKWESEGVLSDSDGTLTGSVGYSVAPCTPSFDDTQCTQSTPMSVGIPGCVCTSQIRLARFAFNHIVPESLLGKSALFTTEFGTSVSDFAIKRITHKEGWSFVFMLNHHYNFSFQDAGHITNISYDSTFYGFQDGDYITFTQYADMKPDIFALDGVTNRNMSDSMIEGPNVNHGDWYYSTDDLAITYAIKSESSRKKRSPAGGVDLNINTRIIRCFYLGCEPPPKPMDMKELPPQAQYWSDAEAWINVTYDNEEPGEWDNLTIPEHKYIIVDKPIPKLKNLVIEGGLEFANNLDHVLEADYIYITGRMIAGWSDAKPLTNGSLRIILRGSHSTPAFPSNGVAIGAKFIGVFGGLQLHGEDVAVPKTHLATTANAGDSTITTSDVTGWKVGNEIMITTTDYNAWHTETFRIRAISGTAITLNGTLQHRHIAHTETVNGRTIELRASVALFTRNIVIEGEEYDDLISESFGARVLVSQATDYKGQHSGFAQISNVEFYHTGQEGFRESYDARFSLTFMDVTSTPGEIRYSYVRKSTFHNGFNTAIGAFAVDDLEIDNNVVHHTVGPGIWTEATGTRVTNNLVALSIWNGAYLNRAEPLNILFDGAIELTHSTDAVLVNNSVYGAERMGYAVPGQSCSTASADRWSNNFVEGALLGVGMFPMDTKVDPDCVLYTGFTAWKNLDFGLYYQDRTDIVMDNNVLVENGVGIFALVIGPSIVNHQFGDSSAEYNNNIFIGKTSSFSESLDVIDRSDTNILLSEQARSSSSGSPCGKVGAMITTFSAGPNNAPEKPFQGIMAYNPMNGITYMDGNVFANFGACTGGRDHAIATNKKNDDANFPLRITNTVLENTDMESKIFFHPPNVGKINSADCVDMDCDGLKKVMVHDDDGTFLGHVGTILPDSAHEWDGDRRHGLGDYRVPTAMLTTADGKKIDIATYAPHKGVFKTDNCSWIESWRGFKCKDYYNWKMLSIESMDADTETRRISPVAVFNPEGYIDLINGPQDHGWCSGYTCRKRVSTFQAIVATGHPFDIFLSSTNPRDMRYILLDSDSSECVRVGMWYMNQNRLTVYVDGQKVLPSNGYEDSSGNFRLRTQNTNHVWMPEATSTTVGENFLSRAESMLFWVVCGGHMVEVKTEDVFVVSFTLPAMTEAEFFGEKIVENLAAFLDLDPSQVRIVDIVEDTSSSGRRKRSARTTQFTVEIADRPGDIQTVDYSTVGQRLCNHAQLYGMDDVINATVLYTSVLEPGSPGVQTGEMTTLQKTGNMVLDTHPRANVQEGYEFSRQPKLKVVDDQGTVVSYLGSYTANWEVEASIKSGGSPRARLIGNTTVTFTDGWANFTNLAISNKGDYILEFNIVSPPEAANYSLETMAVRVFGRNIRPKVDIKTTDRLSGYPIEIDILLEDLDSLSDISDIEWANHTWTVTASLPERDAYPGNLGGTTTATFDPSTGKATFYNLQLDLPGKCPILVTVESDPGDYRVTTVVHLDVMSYDQFSMSVEESHDLEIKFDIPYNESRADVWHSKVQTEWSQKNNMRVRGGSHRQGSFIVTMSIEATTDGYNETLTAFCSEIDNSTEYTFDGVTATLMPYLTVDGETYYGVSCGTITSDDDDGLETVYIVLIVILCIVVLALIGVLVAYKFYFHPHAQTNDFNNARYLGQNMRQDLLDDQLSREDTFTSLKSRSMTPNMAPVGTAMPTKTSFDLTIETPGRGIDSPTPRVIRPRPSPTPSVPGFTQPEWRS